MSELFKSKIIIDIFNKTSNILRWQEDEWMRESLNKIGTLEKQKYIFEKLFVLSNKLHAIGDQILAGEMTISQWLLTVAVAQFGRNPPRLSEVAVMMGSSHQNVKQLALKLQKNGFLLIERDAQDRRITSLVLMEKSRIFWEERQEEIKQLLLQLFKDLSDGEINSLSDCLTRLYESVIKMRRLQ